MHLNVDDQEIVRSFSGFLTIRAHPLAMNQLNYSI
jgi:hypothetical protein